MLYHKGKTCLNLVPTAGLEPARPIKPRDFKSLVSTIPPRGQEPDFKLAVTLSSNHQTVSLLRPPVVLLSRAQHVHTPHISKNHSLFSSQTLPPVTVEDDQLNGVAIKVTARGKVPFMLEMRINAAKPLK